MNETNNIKQQMECFQHFNMLITCIRISTILNYKHFRMRINLKIMNWFSDINLLEWLINDMDEILSAKLSFSDKVVGEKQLVVVNYKNRRKS